MNKLNYLFLSYFLWIGFIQSVFSYDLIPIIENLTLQTEELQLIQQINTDSKNADSLFALAKFYANHRYYPNAITLLEHTVQLNPQMDQAYFLLGALLGSQKTGPEQSISALQKAIDLKPKHIPYREELVNVYNRLQRYPPALEQLEVILQLEPDHTESLYKKAVILYTQGNVDEAERLAKQLPNYEHALVLTGLIMQQHGKDSQDIFEDVVKRFPDNIRARYELSKIWMKQKKWNDAQALLEAIIDEDPFYQHALFQLVKLYSLQKETSKAQLAKQSLDTINRIGRDQRNAYRSYLRHHPDTASTHFEMGLIYLEIGRGDLAAAEMLETIHRNPQHADAHFYLAQIYMSSGEFEKAVPQLEKCVPLRKDKAVIHSLLTQCYLELKNALKAKEHLQTALKINPHEPLALRIQQLLENKVKSSFSN